MTINGQIPLFISGAVKVTSLEAIACVALQTSIRAPAKTSP